MLNICRVCKNQYNARPCVIKSGRSRYCSMKCRNIGLTMNKVPEYVKEKIRVAMMGSKNHFYGKKHNEISKQLMGKANIGTAHHLTPHTESTKNKLRLVLRGKNANERHPNWQGGITPINRKIRNSTDMKLWRETVFKRDNWTCQYCKVRGGKLHADHIKPFFVYHDLRLDLMNGQTLCKSCHRWKTSMDLKIFSSKVPELNYACLK